MPWIAGFFDSRASATGTASSSPRIAEITTSWMVSQVPLR